MKNLNKKILSVMMSAAMLLASATFAMADTTGVMYENDFETNGVTNLFNLKNYHYVDDEHGKAMLVRPGAATSSWNTGPMATASFAPDTTKQKYLISFDLKFGQTDQFYQFFMRDTGSDSTWQTGYAEIGNMAFDEFGNVVFADQYTFAATNYAYLDESVVSTEYDTDWHAYDVLIDKENMQVTYFIDGELICSKDVQATRTDATFDIKELYFMTTDLDGNKKSTLYYDADGETVSADYPTTDGTESLYIDNFSITYPEDTNFTASIAASAASKTVELTFSENITGEVDVKLVKKSDGSVVSTTNTVGTDSITLSYTGKLDFGKEYAVVLNKAVAGVSGNAMSAATEFTFIAKSKSPYADKVVFEENFDDNAADLSFFRTGHVYSVENGVLNTEVFAAGWARRDATIYIDIANDDVAMGNQVIVSYDVCLPQQDMNCFVTGPVSNSVLETDASGSAYKKYGSVGFGNTGCVYTIKYPQMGTDMYQDAFKSVAYAKDIWYEVKFVMDRTAKTTQIYFDDELIMTTNAWDYDGNITSIALYQDRGDAAGKSTAGAKMMVDNIKVGYTEADYNEPFTVSDTAFVDMTGADVVSAIDALPKTVYAKAEFSNITSQDKTVLVMVVAYYNDRMVAVDFENVTVGASSTVTLNNASDINVTLPALEEADCYKLFVWDSLTGATPLTEALIIE